MFFDEKTAGIEIIHHGTRTSTGGADKASNTRNSGTLIPSVISRKVDEDGKTITAELRYKDYNFNSRISVTARRMVEIIVYLDKPLPPELEGKAGFNLEFLPSAYFERTYIADGKPGNFSRYPSGSTKSNLQIKDSPVRRSYHYSMTGGLGEFIIPCHLQQAKP